MLTKQQVERLKKTLEANWGVWNVDELLNNQKQLIETLEEAVEIIEKFQEIEFTAKNTEAVILQAKFLAEYERGD